MATYEPYRLTQTGAQVQQDLNDMEALGPATTEAAGLMSVEDKQKLDGIEHGAEANTIETIKVDGETATPDANKVVSIRRAKVITFFIRNDFPEDGTYTGSELATALGIPEAALFSLCTFAYTHVSWMSQTAESKQCPVQTVELGDERPSAAGTRKNNVLRFSFDNETFYTLSASLLMTSQGNSVVSATLSSKSIPTALSQLSEDTTHRVVTDAEKTAWNGKADKGDTPRVVSFENDLDELPGEIIEELRLGDIVSCLGYPYEVMHKTPTEIRLSMGDWFYEFTKSNGVWSYSRQGADLYRKPSGGIPKADLAEAVQTSLGKADTAYQKPTNGIPASDMEARAIPDAVEANPTVPSGTTPTDLTGLKVGSDYYGIPQPTVDNTPTANSNNLVKSGGVYDAINPSVQSSQPAGGMLPNVMYNLGTLTGSVTISFASPTDNTIENEYKFGFTAGSTAPTITWPNGIIWAGNCLDDSTHLPEIDADTYYEVSVKDGKGIIAKFQ